MPDIFFEHAENIFQLLLVNGPNHWDKQTLLDFVGKCGYQVLSIVNQTLQQYVSQDFCVFSENLIREPTGYETLKLKALNSSFVSEWSCIESQASKYKCDSEQISTLRLCAFILFGLSFICCCICCLEINREVKSKVAQIRENEHILHPEEARALIERRGQSTRERTYGTQRGVQAYTALLNSENLERSSLESETTAAENPSSPYAIDVIA